MLIGMMVSIIITFLLLGLAARLPDPYWSVLLHLQEAGLAVFLFCSVGLFMSSFNRMPRIKFRGRVISSDDGESGSEWKALIAFLMSVTAVTYRYSVIYAFAAYHDRSIQDFNPWSQRGNVFALTLAVMAAVIAMARLRDEHRRNRVIAYITAVSALVSFSPLLMPAGYSPAHPVSILFIALIGAVLYAISRQIQARWEIL